MPPIPSLALAIKALISFVVLGVSITAINAVGFSNDVYTKGSTGIFFTPPVSPPAVEFGRSSDCPECLFVDSDNVRLAPTPTLPLKISWAAPSMVRPKLSPTSIAPSPGNTSTAPTLVSNFSKAEEFILWCKKLSPSIFGRDAAWIIVGGIFLVVFVTASTYLLLYRLPSLRSYLGNATDGNARLKHIFREWQVAEKKRMADWQAVQKKRILDKANANIKEHSREYVQVEKVKLFLKVVDIIDSHRQVPTRMRSELHKLWAAEEFDRVCTKDTISQGEAQQPKSDQRLPATEITSKQKKEEGEAQQPKAAHADGEQGGEANEKHGEAAAPKSELANVLGEVTPQVKEDGAEAHQSQTVSELGADKSRATESLDEQEARGSENAYVPIQQTRNLDDDEKKAEVQQSEDAHVSQNLAFKLEEGRDDGQSQRPEHTDRESEELKQIDAEEETRVPRNQNMGPKHEGNGGDPVIEDVGKQADNESATWRAPNSELEEDIAGFYLRLVNTADNGSTSAKASAMRRCVQEGAEYCIKWYDEQISWLKNATGEGLDSSTTPPSSATTNEDRDAWYTRRLCETRVFKGRITKLIDYEEKRLTMKEKFVSFGWDLRTSTGSFDDSESKHDETGHEEAQDRPSTPQGSYTAPETESQSQGMSKTKKRNLERKRAKAKKVKKTLESQH